MNGYKIAVIPGDGIGKEIIPEGIKILNAVCAEFGFSLEMAEFPWGAGHYAENGSFMPSDALETLQQFHAIYFGAVGLPEVDDTLPAKLFTFRIRTAFRQYVNLRPARLLPGIVSPLRRKRVGDIDFVLIRENTEGEFVQAGQVLRSEMPEGVAVDTSIFTRQGIERIAHYAFQLAQQRRRKLTSITKSNTLIHSLAYWDRVIAEVAPQYPDVHLESMYVDNATANFVLRPEMFDVVLTTNFMGDILSDLGGAIMGSLGLAPSGNINPEKDFPSMFEPIHGSAPDIAGRGIANPIGAVWSAALMLEHLNEGDAANRIIAAIEGTLQSGTLSVDLGGTSATAEVGDSILRHLEAGQ